MSESIKVTKEQQKSLGIFLAANLILVLDDLLLEIVEGLEDEAALSSLREILDRAKELYKKTSKNLTFEVVK